MGSRSMHSANHGVGKPGPEQFLNLSKEQSQGLLNLQKQLLEVYDQAGRAWLARVKSEVDLWSNLAKSLAESRSAPEMLDAYQRCVAQRMQMAAEDGQRLSDECQKIMTKVAQSSLAGGVDRTHVS